MAYTKADLIERSGIADRTLRSYMERGLLPRPEGHGLAAEYTEEHMVRAVAIGRMRAQGLHIDAIVAKIAGWSTAKFRRFVTSTEPKAPPPAPGPANPAPAPGPAEAHPPPTFAEADGAPAPSSPSLPPASGARSHGSEATTLPPAGRLEPIVDAALPAGHSFRIVPLLPGLALMLDHDAAPIVRRIAAEICERYGHLR